MTSIKYVTLFLANFDPPPSVTLCHTSRDPPKVCHTSRTLYTCTKIRNKSHLYKFYLNYSLRVFVRGFCQGGLLSGRFCPGWFCPFPLNSVAIHLLQQKVKHHFKFHFSYVAYDKNVYKRDGAGRLGAAVWAPPFGRRRLGAGVWAHGRLGAGRLGAGPYARGNRIL